MMPMASPSSVSFGSGSSLIHTKSDLKSFDHLLLLEKPLLNFASLDRLFNFLSDLSVFKILPWRCLSSWMSTRTSLSEFMFQVHLETFRGRSNLWLQRLKAKKKVAIVQSQSLLSTGFSIACFSTLLCCLTTTAIWLWPFWNSFSMSYKGIVSGTLEDEEWLSSKLDSDLVLKKHKNFRRWSWRT